MKTITTLNEIQMALKDGAILVDIREKDEWDKSHLQKALFCPLSAIEKGNRTFFSKEQTYLLHCARGGRAQVAQKALEREGYDVTAVLMNFDELKQQL